MPGQVSATRSERRAPAREPGPAYSLRSPPTVREAALACACLAALAALTFAPHLLHGGFYLDDWSDSAATLFPSGGSGFGDLLAHFAALLSGCRPVLIVFLPLKYVVFGAHMKYLLALAVLLAVAVATLLYAVLRALGVPWRHAGLIAALTIVYPWFDSTRFWESASLSSLAIAFALAGLWIALLGLSRDSWRLHGCAALLYLLSILTYEITLPLIAAAGVLYVFRSGWRRARGRWAVDLGVVVAGGLWDWAHTPRSVSSPSGDLSHLGEIVSGGGEMLGRTLLPLGLEPHTALTLGVLTAILGAGLVAYLAMPDRPSQRPGWGLREWLLLALGGLAVTVLGWAMLIPADSYYTPVIYGVTNRVNALAGLGLVIVVYAALGVVGAFVGGLFRKRLGLATATTIVLGLVLAAAYVHVLERHGRLWDAAFRSEVAAMNRMQEVFPRLPHGTTVFTSDYPANLTLGVPILSSTWDVSGMIKLRYGDGTLQAYPVTSELKLLCRAGGVGIGEAGSVAALARYGTARLLNLSTGGQAEPENRQQCLAARPSYPPGPLYVSTAY